LMSIPASPAWSSMSARSWDTDVWVGSPSAAEREIGWRARFDFETGLRHTIAWFRDNPEHLAFYTPRILGA